MTDKAVTFTFNFAVTDPDIQGGGEPFTVTETLNITAFQFFTGVSVSGVSVSGVSVSNASATLHEDHYLIKTSGSEILSIGNAKFTLNNKFVNLLDGGKLVLVSGSKSVEATVEYGNYVANNLPLYTDGTFKDYDIKYQIGDSGTLIDTGCNISLIAMAVYDNEKLGNLKNIQFGRAYKVATVFNPLNWRVETTAAEHLALTADGRVIATQTYNKNYDTTLKYKFYDANGALQNERGSGAYLLKVAEPVTVKASNATVILGKSLPLSDLFNIVSLPKSNEGDYAGFTMSVQADSSDIEFQNGNVLIKNQMTGEAVTFTFTFRDNYHNFADRELIYTVSKTVNITTAFPTNIIESVTTARAGHRVDRDGSRFIYVAPDFETNGASIQVKLTEDCVNASTGRYFNLVLVPDGGGAEFGFDSYSPCTSTFNITFADDQSENSKPIKVRKVYHIKYRLANGGPLFDTGYTIGWFIIADFADLQGKTFKAERVYDVCDIHNPNQYALSPSAGGSLAGHVRLNGDGTLTALTPGQGSLSLSYQIGYNTGTTPRSTDPHDVTIESPVSAKVSSLTLTKGEEKPLSDVFAIDLPEEGQQGYAHFALTGVTASSNKVVVEQSGGEWTVKAANGASLTNQAVTFTFTFSNGGPNGTEELTFSAAEAVNVTAGSQTGGGGTPAPGSAHPVAVLAGKTALALGETVQLFVPGESISNAYSSDLSVAFATGDGRVIAIAPGTATVYVTTKEHGEGSIRVTVTGASAQAYADRTVLAEGETARIYFDGGAPVISAFSGNANVVKVSSSGLVTAVSPGTATVYVTGANGASGTVAFTVTPKGLKVSGKAGITVGETARLTLSGGETVANVTSSNPSVVSVTGDGTYTGAAEGTATLTVTSRSGKTATFAVTVVKKEGGKASERTLLVDQALQLKVIGRKILSASLEENSGAIAVTGTGKVTALSEGTDTVLLVTDDHQVHRVKVTVNARKGKVSVKEGRLRLRKTAGTGSIVAHLANGAAVTILERAGIYYRVQATVNGKTYTGFVPRSYVKK